MYRIVAIIQIYFLNRIECSIIPPCRSGHPISRRQRQKCEIDILESSLPHIPVQYHTRITSCSAPHLSAPTHNTNYKYGMRIPSLAEEPCATSGPSSASLASVPFSLVKAHYVGSAAAAAQYYPPTLRQQHPDSVLELE